MALTRPAGRAQNRGRIREVRLTLTLWRQQKRTVTHAHALMKQGLTEERAWRAATNGRGAWWNAGAHHMHAAFPKSYFDRMGLVSLVDAGPRFRPAS